jgi:N-acetylglucosamine-6-phosphate deacetylase
MMRTQGLCDLQVNGFAGVDFNDAALTASAFEHACAAMLRTGVTTFLPTLITATPQALEARLAALDAAVEGSRLGRLMAPGYHLEGPFLNPGPGFRGCHPHEAMIAPDTALIERLAARARRPILLVTYAPERDPGFGFARAMTQAGRLLALGHCDVDFALARAAAQAGASLSTHLGNGSPQHHHKMRNPIFAQLAEDRLTACLIADGLHLPPEVVGVMIRAKGAQRVILVTDATAAAAAPPGDYTLGALAIRRAADGSVRDPATGGLAGSALTLDQAARNLADWGVAPFAQALDMASLRPRAALAPALERAGATGAPGAVDWTADRRVGRARVGDVEIAA